MEVSALPAPAGLARPRTSIGAPLLKLRSDEQLVALFRAGHDEAFRAIHDRYRQRLFAYTRQMLSSRQDAEDALQDIFVRAYAGLRANDRELALRAWLYRVAHNRCIDELRRPAPPPPEVLELVRTPAHDPIAAAEQRESLRRLIADVRRLPGQQRSALLMRELGGMTYADVADALGVSVPAVKSLLVRARVGLARALEARDTACSEIREELIEAHDRGVRPSGTARRHLRDCDGCRDFRREVRGVSRRFAALVPTMGPLGLLAKVGLGGGAGGGAAAGGSLAVAGGSIGAGGATAGILATGAGHVATLLAAAVVTAGGAVELQHTIAAAPVHHHRARHHRKPAAHATNRDRGRRRAGHSNRADNESRTGASADSARQRDACGVGQSQPSRRPPAHRRSRTAQVAGIGRRDHHARERCDDRLPGPGRHLRCRRDLLELGRLSFRRFGFVGRDPGRRSLVLHVCSRRIRSRVLCDFSRRTRSVGLRGRSRRDADGRAHACAVGSRLPGTRELAGKRRRCQHRDGGHHDESGRECDHAPARGRGLLDGSHLGR